MVRAHWTDHEALIAAIVEPSHKSMTMFNDAMMLRDDGKTLCTVNTQTDGINKLEAELQGLQAPMPCVVGLCLAAREWAYLRRGRIAAAFQPPS
jgi:hypothetical protein